LVDEGVAIEAGIVGGRRMAAFLRTDGRTGSEVNLGGLATSGRFKAIVTDSAGHVLDQMEIPDR
jgi:hypothetical protein